MKRPQCHVACPSPLLNVKSHKWASASKWTMNVQHLFVACILYSYSAAEGQFAMVIFWHGGQILRWAVWGFRAWEDGSVRPILRFENLRDRAHGARRHMAEKSSWQRDAIWDGSRTLPQQLQDRLTQKRCSWFTVQLNGFFVSLSS